MLDLTINYREVGDKAWAMKIQIFISVADSDPGTRSTGYREVCDKAQTVRTHNWMHTQIKIVLTLIKVQEVQGTGRFLIRHRQ
jgi:hypothetical protein